MTDQTLLTQLQYALLEPPDGGQSWPSGLWTRDEVVNLLTQRQSRLQKEAQLHVALASPNLTVVINQTRVDLPTDCIRCVTVVWRGSDGTVRELDRADSFEADHLASTWEATAATYPLVYMEFDALQNQIQIAPKPSVAGEIELLYLPTGGNLTGNGVSLTVPDDCAPILKYGTLQDQFAKDGRGQDLTRAAACEEVYQLGVDVVRLMIKGWA